MGDRVLVPVGVLRDAADGLRVVRDVLADLDDLALHEDALGDPGVADASVEVRDGWQLDRAVLRQRLGTLAGLVDAAVSAAEDADATIVSGRADG